MKKLNKWHKTKMSEETESNYNERPEDSQDYNPQTTEEEKERLINHESPAELSDLLEGKS